MEKWRGKISEVQVDRRADFLYGKMERKNVQSAGGWARRFSIWKKRRIKSPKMKRAFSIYKNSKLKSPKRAEILGDFDCIFSYIENFVLFLKDRFLYRKKFFIFGR